MSTAPRTCGTCRHFLPPLDEAGKPLRGYGWAKDCACPVPIAVSVLGREKVTARTSAKFCQCYQPKTPNAEASR